MTDPASRFGGSATAPGNCRGCGLAAICAAPALVRVLLGLLGELAAENGRMPSGPQNSQPVPVPDPDPDGPQPGGGDQPGRWDPDEDPADPRKLEPAGV